MLIALPINIIALPRHTVPKVGGGLPNRNSAHIYLMIKHDKYR